MKKTHGALNKDLNCCKIILKFKCKHVQNNGLETYDCLDSGFINCFANANVLDLYV